MLVGIIYGVPQALSLVPRGVLGCARTVFLGARELLINKSQLLVFCLCYLLKTREGDKQRPVYPLPDKCLCDLYIYYSASSPLGFGSSFTLFRM